MKKIFLLLVVAAATAFTSCNNDDDRVVVDNDTIGETFDVGSVNFTPDPANPASNMWAATVPLDPAIFDSDVILVYRQSGLSAGKPIWDLMPNAYYLPEGELNYSADFSVNEVVLYVSAEFPLETTPQYTQNQRFRVVIVPSDFSATVDKSNYDAVVNALNISENDIQMVEMNKIY